MDERAQAQALILTTSPKALAAGALRKILATRPELARVPGRSLEPELLADLEMQVHWLAEAVATDRPALFVDYVRWLALALPRRGLAEGYLAHALACLRQELDQVLPEAGRDRAVGCLIEGQAGLAAPAPVVPRPIERPGPHRILALRVLEELLAVQGEGAVQRLLAAHRGGVGLVTLHGHVIQPILVEIGWLWQQGDLGVATEHYATGVIRRALILLAAQEPRQPRKGQRVLLAAVGGELHDLGLCMVAEQLEAGGYDTITLGANTPGLDLAEAVVEMEPALVVLAMQQGLHARTLLGAIQRLHRATAPAHLPVLVGGRAFQVVPDLWQVVGADAVAHDLESAAPTVARLLGG